MTERLEVIESFPTISLATEISPAEWFISKPLNCFTQSVDGGREPGGGFLNLLGSEYYSSGWFGFDGERTQSGVLATSL